jgi:hypothetical protein
MATTAAPLTKLREANHALDHPEQLNAHLEEDGYLFFRDMVDVEAVRAVKEDFIAVLARQGIVKADASEALWTGAGLEAIEDAELYGVPSYLSLATSEGISKLARKIFGEPVFMVRDANIRYALSGDSVHVTPPNQDYFFIRMNERFRTL